MGAPLISVIVPVYNGQTTIKRCVNSILQQPFSDFELIIVDDGSDDGTSSICDDYAQMDKRVKVIHKTNGGVSSSRNVGLDAARGTLICFADADDYVSNQWLSTFVELSERFPDSLIVENVLIHEPCRSYHRYQGRFGQRPINDLWARGCWGYSINKIFKKAIIDKNRIRFDEKIKVMEDELFVARYCSVIDTVYFSEVVGYCYENTELLADKYGDELVFSKLLYHYRQVKEYNHLCSQSLVDRLVMTAYEELMNKRCSFSIVEDMCCWVAEDIKYIVGGKKLLLRFLAVLHSPKIWKGVFRLYVDLKIL